MRIKNIMTAGVNSIQSTDSIADAARRMAHDGIGALPILKGGKLVGIVTDRDIAVRAVAAGISSKTPVERIMSKDVATCSPDDDLPSVLAFMWREQVRRMPVCNAAKEVIGIVALADMAERDGEKREVAETLADICEPSGQHCQEPVFA